VAAAATDKSRDNDFYTLAIVTNVLTEVNSAVADKAFEHLWSLRQNETDDKIFFAKPKREKPKKPIRVWYYSYLNQPEANAIEATAYALNVCIKRNMTERALPLVKWLVSKQNKFGGFSSTQDTVVAINALAQFAVSAYDPNVSLKVTFDSPDLTGASKPALHNTFDISKENMLVLQQSELSERGFEKEFEALKTVNVKAVGTGSAVVQVAWQYNVVKEDENKFFDVETEVTQLGKSSVSLKVCTRLTSGGDTNMAIVSIETPSGFEFDSESIHQLRTDSNEVRRIDIAKSNTEASFYFDQVSHFRFFVPIKDSRSA
jgi:CD109 antigen